MLSNMTYLNVRHTLPMLGWQVHSFTLKTSMTQPEMHGTRREASANRGATQVRIDIDSYESRKAYGFRKDADLCADFKNAGLAGVKQGTSRRSSEAWQAIDGAAKPNADFFQRQAKSKITAEIKEQKEIELKPIPRPKITVYPAELKGTPDVGEHSIDIRSEPFATYDYEPGSIEYNMKVEGSIHMWTSIGRYDTYA
ncbi:DUF6470 family protein [uncultured Selenomonas sp.]|uniref:DUF6470 family protein n=1 Tax=uncultured Selenomonas sp. TaxID=159275 RepID=UPI0028DB2A85|nr:DUF6470 family protein [uncultured Selenomonas sp.]